MHVPGITDGGVHLTLQVDVRALKESLWDSMQHVDPEGGSGQHQVTELNTSARQCMLSVKLDTILCVSVWWTSQSCSAAGAPSPEVCQAPLGLLCRCPFTMSYMLFQRTALQAGQRTYLSISASFVCCTWQMKRAWKYLDVPAWTT